MKNHAVARTKEETSRVRCHYLDATDACGIVSTDASEEVGVMTPTEYLAPLSLHDLPLAVPLELASCDIKDPCMYRTHDGFVRVACTVGTVDNEEWWIGVWSSTARYDPATPLHCMTYRFVGRIALLDGPYRAFPHHMVAPSIEWDPSTERYQLIVQVSHLLHEGGILQFSSAGGLNFEFVREVIPARGKWGQDKWSVHDGHATRLPEGHVALVYTGARKIYGIHHHPKAVGDQYLSVMTGYDDQPYGGWRVLSGDDIPWHNKEANVDHPDPEHATEWGTEGCALYRYRIGPFWFMTFVGFLVKGSFGTRQRVSFACARSMNEEYAPLPPAICPPPGGENGHGAFFDTGPNETVVTLVFQERTPGKRWRPRIATFDRTYLERMCVKAYAEKVGLMLVHSNAKRA